jgi:Ca-activated chloride channel family protein
MPGYYLFDYCSGKAKREIHGNRNEGEGIDIMLCFDISGSMTEKDFTPDRMEASKTSGDEFCK